MSAKLPKNCSNQHTDLLRLLITEDSLKIKKSEISFQALIFLKKFGKKFSFVILHKVAVC